MSYYVNQQNCNHNDVFIIPDMPKSGQQSYARFRATIMWLSGDVYVHADLHRLSVERASVDHMQGT